MLFSLFNIIIFRVKDNNRIKVTKFLQATDKEDVGLLLLEMKAQLMHVYGQTYK